MTSLYDRLNEVHKSLTKATGKLVFSLEKRVMRPETFEDVIDELTTQRDELIQIINDARQGVRPK